jgi:hypothetical protein
MWWIGDWLRVGERSLPKRLPLAGLRKNSAPRSTAARTALAPLRAKHPACVIVNRLDDLVVAAPAHRVSPADRNANSQPDDRGQGKNGQRLHDPPRG